MTKDEALKLALEALAYLQTIVDTERGPRAMDAIREALTQPEQEPQKQDWKTPPKEDAPLVKWAKEQTPTHRKPLTDEEILHRVDTHVGGPSPSYPLDNSDWLNFARAIEAAHGIKEEA